MPVQVRTELKSGQRPVQKNVKTFKPGEVIFEEGSTGREMCIIEEGKVGVYKESTEGLVELAVIEKGGVLGEMSLLDNLPRSATVKAIDTTKALVINQLVFQTAVQQVPVWLNSIIKIVVSRLRDANKRVDQTVLRDRERGLVSLMLLLLHEYKHEFNTQPALDYNFVCVEAYFVCRLKKKDIVKLVDQLKARGVITIEEDAEHTKHICIRDVEVLRLFEEYLNLKGQKKTFKEASVPEESIAILSNVAYVAQKAGTETPDGTALLKSAVVADLKDKNADKIERNLMELRRRGLINILPSGGDSQIVFRKEVLSRIKKIKEWLPRFEKTFQQQ